MSENPDPDKYSYSWYGILVNVCGIFWYPNGEFSKSVVTSVPDMSSSVHVDNKKSYLNSW